MRLHDVFAAPESGGPLTKPVKFRALNPKRAAKDPPAPAREVSAVFVLADEPETSAAVRDAEIAVRDAYREKDGTPIPIPEHARQSEQVYQLLFRVLRDESDPSVPIAQTVLELRRAIPPVTAQRLMRAYNEWSDAENPDTITAEAMAAMEDEAAGK
jgi:hypothetical protein